MTRCWTRLLSLFLALCLLGALIPVNWAIEVEEPVSGDQTEDAGRLEEDDTDLTETEEAEVDIQGSEEPDDAEIPEEIPEQDTPGGEGEMEPDGSAPTEPEVPNMLPVQQEPAALELPAQVPTSPAADYHALTLEGTLDYGAAFDVLTQINRLRSQNQCAALVMDETALEAAMLRAAENAVSFGSTRPNGTDALTVLGDLGLLYTSAEELRSGTAETAQEAVAAWAEESGLLSTDYTCAGVGCFYQKDGTKYWVLLLAQSSWQPAEQTENVTGPVSVDYLDGQLGACRLEVSCGSSLDVRESAQVELWLTNAGNGTSVRLSPETVRYASSDDDVLRVDDAGTITAVDKGTATVTATVQTDERLSASARITCVLDLATPKLTDIYNIVGGVRIKWEPVTSADGYGIWRKGSRSDSWRLIGRTEEACNYLDQTAQSGNSYIYTVRPYYYPAGKTDYTWGPTYDYTGLSIRYLSSPVLRSAAASSVGITISWEKVDGARSYYIYRRTGNQNWVRIQQASYRLDSFVDSTAVAGTTYTYTVRACHTGTLSSYDSKGVTAKATVNVGTEAAIARTTVVYRTGAGTNYQRAGSYSAGSTVRYLANQSRTVGGVTWYIVNVKGELFYLSANDLLLTPELSTASNVFGGITVQWKRVANAKGYRIYRKPPGGSWVQIGTVRSGGTLSYTDKTVSSGSNYVYTVRAYYDSILSRYDSTGLTVLCLESPALLSAGSVSGGIRVTWEKVNGAQKYAVYRRIPGGGWNRIATLSASSTSYTDATVQESTQYQYTVRAITGNTISYYVTAGIDGLYVPPNKLATYVVRAGVKYRTGAGTSYSSPGTLKAGTAIQVVTGWSRTANGYTWYRFLSGNRLYYVASSYLLATPKLKSVAISGSGLQVRWEKVANATGYSVHRKVAGSGWTTIAKLTSGNTVTYTDTSAVSGQEYIYTVRATYGSVQSDYARTGISGCYLSTPRLTGATASTSGITVNWSRVTGADGYYVYRKVSGGGWKRIATVNSGNTISYRDSTDLIQGTTYIYTVRAYHGSISSDYQSTGVSARATATVNPVTKTYVTQGQVNYRTGPGTSYPIAGTLKNNTRVTVIPSGSKSGWHMVRIDGKYYYMSASYLRAV